MGVHAQGTFMYHHHYQESILTLIQDDRDVEESWSAPGDHEDACRILEGWTPAVHEIVRMTPPERLVDWKLVGASIIIAHGSS